MGGEDERLDINFCMIEIFAASTCSVQYIFDNPRGGYAKISGECCNYLSSIRCLYRS